MSEKTRLAVKAPEAKKESHASNKTQKPDFLHSISSPIDQILFLQRTIGNQAVQRLFKSGVIQAKLRIGQPGDIYEQEADRVAEQVMRMPDPRVQQQPLEGEEAEIQTKHLVEQITPLVQRQIEEEEEEKKEEEILQTKKNSGQTPEATPNLEYRIQALKGGGQPLSNSARAFFEPRFGRVFSQVRVHTNSQAAKTAQAINAKAFTTGRDVVFGVGQYSPETSAGKKLLAHELTHVVQQTNVLCKQIEKKQREEYKPILIDDKTLQKCISAKSIKRPFGTEFIQYERGQTLPDKDRNKRFIVHVDREFITFIMNNKGYQQRIRGFHNNVWWEKLSTEVVERTRWAQGISVVYRYGTVLVIVIVRPDILVDVAEKIAKGESIVDEKAMRDYLSSIIVGPLGKIKGPKLIEYLMENVLQPAAKNAIEQLLEKGEIEPSELSEQVLKTVIENELGKGFAELPDEIQQLMNELDEYNKKRSKESASPSQ